MFRNCFPDYVPRQEQEQVPERDEVETVEQYGIIPYLLGWKGTSGFGSSSTAAEVLETLDLTGKVFLLTGATSSVGVEIASSLVNTGASLILACRNIDKGEQLAQQLCNYRPGSNVKVLKCDLASLASVRGCAECIKALGYPLHCLLHCASIVAVPFHLTEDGYEAHWGVNYVSAYVLTRELMPLLLASAAASGQPSRVVYVSCHYHYFTYKTGAQRGRGINFRRVESQSAAQNFTAMESFAQSKLALILLAKELARRLQRSPNPVEIFAVHPGITYDGFTRAWGHQPGTWLQYFKDSLASAAAYAKAIKRPEQAAAGVVYCAAHPSATGCSGTYWVDCSPARPSKPARDVLAPTLLWQLTEESLARRNIKMEDLLA